MLSWSSILTAVFSGVWVGALGIVFYAISDKPIVIGALVVLVVLFSILSRDTAGTLGRLLVPIHSPNLKEWPSRWWSRALSSACLYLSGAMVGPEGSAIEAAYGIGIFKRQSAFLSWIRKRREAATAAISAGVSAALGAPFTAALLPLELRMGGGPIPAVLASLAAYLTISVFAHSNQGFSVPPGWDWSMRVDDGVGLLIVMALSTIAALLCARLMTYFFRLFSARSQRLSDFRTYLGGVVLLLILLFTAEWGRSMPKEQFFQLVWRPLGWYSESGYFFLRLLLLLTVAISLIGTTGVFASLLCMGGVLGIWIQASVLHAGDWAMSASFPGLAAIVGGVVFLSVLINVPISASLLVYEWTRSPTALIVAMVSAFFGQFVRRALRVDSLISAELQTAGIRLVGGRSIEVLERVKISDVMVKDHETIQEREPISELRKHLLESKHPFIPVTNQSGYYVGLLTVEMLEDERLWASERPKKETISELLAAGDLFYKSEFRIPGVKEGEKLTSVLPRLAVFPCLPVLSEDGKVVGLLFEHQVRLAYDKEILREAMIQRRPG